MTTSAPNEHIKQLPSLKMLKALHFWASCGATRRSASYIALFRPLQDIQSRLVLLGGILFAIAAGAPLPIIGVIFARIIDVFPPTEEEVRMRVFQLLAVGK